MRVENILAEMGRNRYTRTRLSNALGVDRRTLSGWLDEGKEIPSSKLILMAELFSCSIDYLLGVNKTA